MRSVLKGAFAVLVAALLAAGCGSSASDSSPPPAHTNPLAGQTFYVNPANPAQQQYQLLRHQGNDQAAAAIAPLATTPDSTWLNGSAQDANTIATVSRAAKAANQLPVFVMYNIPGRNCGGNSAGGAYNDQVYQGWYRDDAAALAGPAVFVIEPDLIPELIDTCPGPPGHVSDMLGLINDEVHTLKVHPGVLVYIDAGNSGWVQNPADLVPDLKAAGIAAADGVSLNVANFLPTATEVAYGQQLAKLLGGKGVIIDTSRNGHTVDGSDPCNPPGAALGQRPTTDTHEAYIDAFFWGKTVGTSDGDGANCHGGPAAGQFWQEDAVGLVQGNAP
jgi:endoglucanase